MSIHPNKDLQILVLCTGNSCRSILAEALFNHLGQKRLNAFSAGSHPTGQVHPQALKTLQSHNLSVTGLSSQSWNEFEHLDIDIVITVCDNAAGEACPVYLNKAIKVHWGLPDPALICGTEEEIRTAFENTFSALEQRISKMLALPFEQLSDHELTKKLNTIGA